jgi:hypothetical protein
MTSEVSKWFDFRRFVKGHTVQPPAAYASLDEFNRALESVVLGHDRLEMPPEDHPTWHHPKLRIGPDINNAEGGPVKELEDADACCRGRVFCQRAERRPPSLPVAAAG